MSSRLAAQKKVITMTLKSHHCVSELALSKQSIVRHFTVVKVSRGLCQWVSWCAKICGVHTTKNRPFELVCKMFASLFFQQAIGVKASYHVLVHTVFVFACNKMLMSPWIALIVWVFCIKRSHQHKIQVIVKLNAPEGL